MFDGQLFPMMDETNHEIHYQSNVAPKESSKLYQNYSKLSK